jgi:hypothetical protein
MDSCTIFILVTASRVHRTSPDRLHTEQYNYYICKYMMRVEHPIQVGEEYARAADLNINELDHNVLSSYMDCYFDHV